MFKLGISKISAIIPCAGLSSRMNDYKPLMMVGSVSVIESTINNFIACGIKDIVVVLGFNAMLLKNYLLSKYDSKVVNLIFVYNENYSTSDMLYSIKLGIKSLPECSGFFILPADIPFIKPLTLSLLLKRLILTSNIPNIVFPTFDGKRKHPCLVNSNIKNDILSYSGENGLRGLWQSGKYRVDEVEVNDKGVFMDLDTPEDYKACLGIFKKSVF